MKLHTITRTHTQFWTDACVLFKKNRTPYKAGIGIFIRTRHDEFALSAPVQDLYPINSSNAELVAVYRSLQLTHINQFDTTRIWTDSQHAVDLCKKWSQPAFSPHSISYMKHNIKTIQHPFMIPIYYLYTQLIRDGVQIQISHVNFYNPDTTHTLPTNRKCAEHKIAHNLARKGAERSEPIYYNKN